ncbi:hypothetical protein AB0O57_29140 [Streptomyces sp. NPDC091201]|uniref:hypothetical protein n=1 Tax=Streptomyces sp. NPDC091201 TaxID=3155190 RepID=UPI00342FEB9D
MGAKNQALKNAAQRRAAETGQSYAAALKDVRKEYEEGQHAETGHEDRMGFAAAASTSEYRLATAVTGYFFAWGVHELIGAGQEKALAEHAEKHGQPGQADPILCHLCDRPIDVTREREVHVGLALRAVQQPNQPQPTELQFPVWTHDECGHTRVWSWSQLTLERRRRGLPVETAALPPKQHRRGRTRVEDYAMFSVPEDSPPVFYLQPGDVHRHGPLGFRADRLSDGLPAVDLTREDLRLLPEWSITVDGSNISYLEREGTGRWYQPDRPWTAPTEWLAAAHYHQSVILLTAPAGSVPGDQLDANAGDLSALLAVGRGDLLFGARVAVTGLG